MFSGSDPIRVIKFLRAFHDSADYNNASEGVVAHLLPYLLKGTAASRYRTQLARTRSQRHLYLHLVQDMLKCYATQNVMSQAYQSVLQLPQNANEDKQEFGGRLLDTAFVVPCAQRALS